MATVKAIYKGNLRVECEHLQSGNKIITDAPVDNKGKGEAFSPTDMCATALGACMMTIMGIYAEERGLSLEGTEISITKKMGIDPRRISGIDVVFTMPKFAFSDKDIKGIERAAHTCPMFYSLREDIVKNVVFDWGK